MTIMISCNYNRFTGKRSQRWRLWAALPPTTFWNELAIAVKRHA